MKFLIALVLCVAAATSNPIQVENNNIGDIVTVEMNFNGVLSVVVDEENVDTNVGLSKVGGADNSAKLLEFLLSLIQNLTNDENNVGTESSKPMFKIPASVQPAIESFLKKMQPLQ